VDVNKGINIKAPIDLVFGFFSHYDNFPQFMSNVKEVRDPGTGRSHWVVAGPAGISFLISTSSAAIGSGRGSYVTSAGAGPSIGKHILMAYLPPEQAVAGEQLLVEYLGERYPVTVAVADSTPVFDPENTRIRS